MNDYPRLTCEKGWYKRQTGAMEMGANTLGRLVLIEDVDLRAMTECVEIELKCLQIGIYKTSENKDLCRAHADLTTGLWFLQGYRVAQAIEIDAVWTVIHKKLL